MNLHFQKLVAETLNVPLDTVQDELAYNSISEWDSIAHMALIAAMDAEYDILMDTEDVIDMSSIAKAREILKKYGVEV